jgi:hypothetical protein
MATKAPLEQVTVNVPSNLNDINAMCEGTGLQPDRIRLFFNLYFLKRMQGSRIKEIANSSTFKEGYVSLSSRTLITLLTNRYGSYIEFLERSGVIILFRDWDTNRPKYSKNGAPIRYRIAERFMNNGIDISPCKHEQITERRSIKAYNNLKNRVTVAAELNEYRTPVGERMEEMVARVYFDLEGSQSLLSELSVKETNPDKIKHYKDQFMVMQAFNEGKVHCSRDYFGERFTTAITTLPKILRPFIRFHDDPEEPRVILDITNSQPFFSSIAVSANLVWKVLPEFHPCMSFLTALNKTDDFMLYQDLCKTGRLYEYYAGIRGVDRDTAKGEIFYIMFSGNHKGFENRPPQVAFKRKFPSVFEKFRILKSLTDEQLPFMRQFYKKNKTSNLNLSSMMQRMESRILIGRVMPRLFDFGIKNILTVHDSFIVKESDEDITRTIIKEVFKELGVSAPDIKTEMLNPAKFIQ